MAYQSETARPEDIEREIEQDRQRIGRKLDEIQNRMSPGQLVDEAIAYAKGSGGAEFVSNLTGSMKTNPVPVALMAISLAWLMASGNRNTSGSDHHDAMQEEHHYPLATVTTPVQRMGPVEQGSTGSGRVSHFKDAAGTRFRAITDETGRRAGHFIDEGGKTYRGFVDSTGRRVHDIRDETGKVFDDASGWLSDTVESLAHSASRMGRTIREAGRSAGRGSVAMGASMRDQTMRMNEGLMRQFQDQPLIGGALAFAIGAAIGAALPRTEREDEMMGEMADEVKSNVAARASSALDDAEHIASDVSQKVASVVAEVHDVARDRIVEETQQYRSGNGSTTTRPH